MDRVTALQNAAGIARNQQLVGEGDGQYYDYTGMTPPRVPYEYVRPRKEQPYPGVDSTNQYFRNSVMGDMRTDMDEVISGEGYAHHVGLGRDLTTGNWADAHIAGERAAKMEIDGMNFPIATDRERILRAAQNNARYMK